MIPINLIQSTAEILMDKAAIEIPQDYLDGLQEAAKTEDGDLSSFVLKAMLENYEAAKEDRRAMCGDTGVPRWFVKLGNAAQVEGGMVALEAALRRATANATNGVPLRPNRVHPLWRTDHNNNVGIGAPEIEYGFEPEGAWVDLITVHKGGLFGSDYRMLFPSDGIHRRAANSMTSNNRIKVSDGIWRNWCGWLSSLAVAGSISIDFYVL